MTTARVQFPILNPDGSEDTRVETTDKSNEEAKKVIMRICKYKGQQDILVGFLCYALISLHHEDEYHDLENQIYIQFRVDTGCPPWWRLLTTPGSHGSHIQAETMVFPSRTTESRGNLTTYSSVIWNVYQVWLPALKTFFQENLTAEMVEKVTSSLRYYEAPNLLNIVEFNDPTRAGLEEGEGNLPLEEVERLRELKGLPVPIPPMSNPFRNVVDLINREKEDLTEDFSTKGDEDGDRQPEDPDVKFLGRLVDRIFYRFCLNAVNPTYALENNLIGHTNAIAVGITREHISSGYEVRYSVTRAVIENPNTTHVARNSTQLHYMELVWATHTAVEDRFPLMLHLVLDFTTLKMEDLSERFSGARWDEWQARWEPTPQDPASSSGR